MIKNGTPLTPSQFATIIAAFTKALATVVAEMNPLTAIAAIQGKGKELTEAVNLAYQSVRTGQVITLQSYYRVFSQFQHKEKGWSLDKDSNKHNELDLTKLVLVKIFPGYKGTSRSASDFLEKTEDLNTLGQRHAELLLANQDLIPEEWRAFRLFFPATFWWDDKRRRMMLPTLSWSNSDQYGFFDL
jgi:hypothetical protein